MDDVPVASPRYALGNLRRPAREARDHDGGAPVRAPGDEIERLLWSARLEIGGEQRVLNEIALRAAAPDAHSLR
jgi:hypothetical protein